METQPLLSFRYLRTTCDYSVTLVLEETMQPLRGNLGVPLMETWITWRPSYWWKQHERQFHVVCVTSRVKQMSHNSVSTNCRSNYSPTEGLLRTSSIQGCAGGTFHCLSIHLASSPCVTSAKHNFRSLKVLRFSFSLRCLFSHTSCA